MRQVGSLSNQAEAIRFAAYLVAEGVTAQSERDGQRWVVWVHDENQVAKAKEAFADFQANPDNEKYRGVERKAEEILAERSRVRERASKNIIEMRGMWKRGGQNRRRPLVITLIVMSVAVFIFSGQGNNSTSLAARTALFIDFKRIDDNPASYTGPLVHIRQGEIWRLVTPIFYHFGMVHLVFNMIMLYQLGSPVEDRRGTWRFGLMVLVVAIISNSVHALVPFDLGGSPRLGGMSGVVYGIFGYGWMKSRFQPELGIHIPQSTVMILMIWLFLCMTPIMETYFHMRVANWAHAAGLIVGLVIGYFPILTRSFR